MTMVLGERDRDREAHPMFVGITAAPTWPPDFSPAYQLMRVPVARWAPPVRRQGLPVLLGAVHTRERGQLILRGDPLPSCNFGHSH